MSYAADGSTVVQPESALAFVGGRLDLVLLLEPPAGSTILTAPLSSCAVRPPGQQNLIKLPDDGSKVANGRLSLLGKYIDGRCGVRVQPVSMDDRGTWTLLAQFAQGTNSTASASAAVSVTGRTFQLYIQ